MAVKKITKRWLFNSLGVILVILIALEVVIAFSIKDYYYGSVEKVINSQAETVSGLLSKYHSEETGDYEDYFRGLVTSFEKRNIMELMAMNSDGKVVLTSSGFIPEESSLTPDCFEAENNIEKTAEYIGETNGEKVMSVTVVPEGKTEDFSSFRIVTSLEKVDRQITFAIIGTSLIGIAIIFFVVVSSSYFINSIVNPVGQISETAKKIAEGDFNAKIEKKTDDEIGELCETINYMADELGATERMKNDFISSVSHELRTPLTAIKGWAEMLEDSSKDDSIDSKTLERGMGVIIGETERLSVMVEELLDFSRLQSGRMVLQPMKLDIIAELSEAVLTFEQRAIREKKALIYEEIDDIIAVTGDKNRLRQVFVNIIDNALKYSDEGGSVTISTLRSENGFVDIEVKDTGIGIPADQLEKVKTKFFKGNATRRGSGIGLAVADEIIRMHGGEILLDSIEGEGTTVTIRLPIDK
ncbi:MAG: HAMP domain-containing histidine kinase [Oscillospiraceae bacterium]|nr:HAMP domain-containing histidine kinase [Oscillospiraceae bacterium]MBP1575023.1 HAMP domain-containing histidine kinase [Oscillospiraceae bacterium]MBQ8594878.1 HAMP domain-containing histidine kinase [Oscillospiraceae bacterium]